MDAEGAGAEQRGAAEEGEAAEEGQQVRMVTVDSSVELCVGCPCQLAGALGGKTVCHGHGM